MNSNSPDLEGKSGISRRKYKVGRLIEEHSLYELEGELIESWTKESSERRSLRDLADYFNQRILGVHLRENDVQFYDRELEYKYQILTDKNVTGGMRTRESRDLEKEGVNIDTVKQDFVSHQALHTYLTECHGIKYPDDDEDQIEKETEKIKRLQSRTENVVSSTIKRLQSTGQISINSSKVFMEVNVMCEECGTYYEVNELLERKKCECEYS